MDSRMQRLIAGGDVKAGSVGVGQFGTEEGE
jgi:hypothetical protein